MLFKILVITLLILTINSISQIDVLFESLCPDSINFITKSFRPFFEAIDHQKLANVTFYPYGNAQQKFDGKKWDFICQHGVNECYGNLIESCAIKHNDNVFVSKFIICVEGKIKMFRQDFNATVKECLKNEDPKINTTLFECVNSDEGNKYQHEIATFTEGIVPPHTYVPWIIVDGKHDAQIETYIIEDMLKYLCEKTDNPISACKHRTQSLEYLSEE